MSLDLSQGGASWRCMGELFLERFLGVGWAGVEPISVFSQKGSVGASFWQISNQLCATHATLVCEVMLCQV